MRLLDSASLLAGAAGLEALPGQYSAFVLRVAGTTAGAAASATDVGLVTAKWRSRPFTSVRFTDLLTIGDMILGEPENVTATPFSFTVAIPASFVGDGNIFDVSDSDQFYISVDLSGAAGVAGAAWTGGTISLYGIPADGLQMYLPQMFTHTESISNGATAVIPLSYENMSQLFVLTTTNLASLQIEVDGDSRVDADVAALQAWSNYECRLENAFTDGLRVNLHRSGAMAEALSDTVVLRASASGGTASPIIVAVCLDYTPDVLDRSKIVVDTKAKAKLAKKQAGGKGRPVQVAKRAFR